jgi:hypothetical protein
MDERRIQHGYGHDPLSGGHRDTEGSLAYHVSRYRQQYGKAGISQRALSMIAHISRAYVEKLEAAHVLQASVEAVLRVAITLRRPVEAIVAPEQLAAITADVEKRRRKLGGDAALPPGERGPVSSDSLGIVYRSPYLIVAFSDGKHILEIRQHRVSHLSLLERYQLLEDAAKRYQTPVCIAEKDSRTATYLWSLKVPFRVVTLAEAKRIVLRGVATEDLTHKRFFSLFVETHPEVERFVRVLVSGNVAMSERWRTSRLLAATLALAAPASKPSEAPPIIVGKPLAPRLYRRTG